MYVFGKTLGEGGTSKVLSAVNSVSGERVAIKIIDKKEATEKGFKFRQEPHVLKRLDHRNIIKLVESLETDEQMWIVMEQGSGGDLFNYLLGKSDPLCESDARKLFQQITDAVDYCHSKGVYHRDLKLENFVLTEDGVPKLADFGLATIADPMLPVDPDRGAILDTYCGTTEYASPGTPRSVRSMPLFS